MSPVDQETLTPMHVAYLMSRFPKISETFVLYEIVALERLGYQVAIFPLIRERESVLHAEAGPLVERAYYSRPTEQKVLAANRSWLRRDPKRYLAMWAAVLRHNLRSPKFLARAVVATLQAAYMAQIMQATGVEHIHAHFATHAALAAYVAHRLTDLPYSFTAHADDIYADQTMLGEKITHASFVAAISDYNRRFLQATFGPAVTERVLVNYCGVDTSVFAPRPERPQHDPLVIVCVARLEAKKGHRYLIDACARLRDAGVRLRCLLIGDGELRGEIEAQIAQLNLGEQVTLLGRQPRPQVQAALANADVMVLPSITTEDRRQEGIPIALMEAMATALPVISTRISGIPELIEHGTSGLLVPERNAVALANALLLLAQNPDAGRVLGMAGRNRVLQVFDLQHNTATLAGYFQQVRATTTVTPKLG